MKDSEPSCTRPFTNEGKHARTAGGKPLNFLQKRCRTRTPDTSAREVDILFVKCTAGAPASDVTTHRNGGSDPLMNQRGHPEPTCLQRSITISRSPHRTRSSALSVHPWPRDGPLPFVYSDARAQHRGARDMTGTAAVLRTDPNLLGESHLRVPSAQPWGRLRLLIHLHRERWRLEPRALNALTAARRHKRARGFTTITVSKMNTKV